MHGATIGSPIDENLRATYHTGNQQTLNIYTIGQYQGPGGAYAGWSSFPWEYQANPARDGITFDYNYLPGGRNAGYNTGKIMVHEIGHWVGLLHTFEGVSFLRLPNSTRIDHALTLRDVTVATTWMIPHLKLLPQEDVQWVAIHAPHQVLIPFVRTSFLSHEGDKI